MQVQILNINPLIRRRWRNFCRLRRARWSLILLALLYFLSLFAELFCAARPLFIRHAGRNCFPLLAFHASSEFDPAAGDTAADYIALEKAGVFDSSFVLWPLVKNDPYRIVPAAEITPRLRDCIRLTPVPRVTGIVLDSGLRILKCTGAAPGFGAAGGTALDGRRFDELWQLPPQLLEALKRRLSGRDDDGAQFRVEPQPGVDLPPVRVRLARATARKVPRKSVRFRLFEAEGEINTVSRQWRFEPGGRLPLRHRAEFAALPEAVRTQAELMRQEGEDGSRQVGWKGSQYRLSFEREKVRYPFRPFPGHWLGLDEAGRDVFARIFYSLRLALNFGLILVVCSLVCGSAFGIMQGYLGGAVDLLGQRLAEIWSALPFLYVMILMGSLYGTGFGLLLFCYAIVNWVGISYYMRAETLRLKNQHYVEAARCLGVPGWKIALRHILPNALVPLITFFPFSLVGAIGALAALDYLGFGMPPPAPSLGEMLAQAQSQRHAWWLVLYPSLTLFTVMLLGVFVGEGLRNAFDARRRQELH